MVQIISIMNSSTIKGNFIFNLYLGLEIYSTEVKTLAWKMDDWESFLSTPYKE